MDFRSAAPKPVALRSERFRAAANNTQKKGRFFNRPKMLNLVAIRAKKPILGHAKRGVVTESFQSPSPSISYNQFIVVFNE